MADLPRLDRRVHDLISDHSDIVDLADDFYKPTSKVARSMGYDIKSADLLPLSPPNDTLYIQPSNVRDADWFGELFDELDPDKKTHPRGIHYQIFGEDRERPEELGDVYEGTKNQFAWLTGGCKYAQILGNVDTHRIKDEKNPSPSPLTTEYDTKPTKRSDRHRTVPRISYTTASAPSTISEAKLRTSFVDLIDGIVSAELRARYGDVEYHAANHQDWIVEVWCEKSDIIPDGLTHWLDTVRTRPAGGGEMSLDMCTDAVNTAKWREQNLAIILLTDYDPKGKDMPRSVARKVEAWAALDEDAIGSSGPPIEAVVFHAALTPEQVEAYDLPAKPISSDHAGYSGQAALFEDNAVEINALASRHPDVLEEAIHDAVRPFVDEELQGRIREAERALKDEARETLRAHYEPGEQNEDDEYAEAREKLAVRHEELAEGIDEYNERLKEQREKVNEAIEAYREQEEQVRDDIDLYSRKRGITDVLHDFNPNEAVEGLEINLPGPDIDEAHGLPEPPILDTRRTIGEQLDVYRHYDYRFGDDK